MTDSRLQPFRIRVSQRRLDDLGARIAAFRWPRGQPGGDWERGVPAGYLRRIAEYWRREYHWREHEEWLNSFPQFTTVIDGQTIHFLHVESPEPDAIPLIVTHGWPGSVVEFTRLLQPLSNPAAHGGDGPAFHLVVPSMPGFGFSGPGVTDGWSARRVAAAWSELMTRLGYPRFAAHGGGRGARVSRELGLLAPERVSAIHVNGGFGYPRGGSGTSELDRARTDRFQRFLADSAAFWVVNSTRPYGIAHALNDSPVGLLAWQLECFREWTDADKPLPDEAVDLDQLLTNVSLYWFTGTAGSAANAYYEDARVADPYRVSTTPTGVAMFTVQDTASRRDNEVANHIVHWSEYFRGGHFAAMEAPDLLVADLREFFRRHFHCTATDIEKSRTVSN